MPPRKNKSKGFGKEAHRLKTAKDTIKHQNAAARRSQASPDGADGAGAAAGDENADPGPAPRHRARSGAAMAAVAGLLFVGLLTVRRCLCRRPVSSPPDASSVRSHRRRRCVWPDPDPDLRAGLCVFGATPKRGTFGTQVSLFPRPRPKTTCNCYMYADDGFQL